MKAKTEDKKTGRKWTRAAKKPCSVCGGPFLMPAKADEPKDSTTLLCFECAHDGFPPSLKKHRKRRYKLLTAKDKKALPGLYGGGDDPVVHVKWFSPWAEWDWYVTSFDGDDTCFGLVRGHEIEWGPFSLSEIDALRTHGNLTVERDILFKPKRISEIQGDLACPG